MAFHEVRLPDDIEQGAEGGPEFKTEISTLANGAENRNFVWSQPRMEWDIAYGIQSRGDLQNVLSFFYARGGRFHGFRFKDWLDYQVLAPITFATGDGSTAAFQLNRVYTDLGGFTYSRTIKKPVSGTVSVFVDGSEDGSASVDTTTGIVTFSSTPAVSADLTWTGEFDVPVRFDVDRIGVNLRNFNAGSIPSIPVVEDPNA